MKIEIELTDTEMDLLNDHAKRCGHGIFENTDSQICLIALLRVCAEEYALQQAESARD